MITGLTACISAHSNPPLRAVQVQFHSTHARPDFWRMGTARQSLNHSHTRVREYLTGWWTPKRSGSSSPRRSRSGVTTNLRESAGELGTGLPRAPGISHGLLELPHRTIDQAPVGFRRRHRYTARRVERESAPPCLSSIHRRLELLVGSWVCAVPR